MQLFIYGNYNLSYLQMLLKTFIHYEVNCRNRSSNHKLSMNCSYYSYLIIPTISIITKQCQALVQAVQPPPLTSLWKWSCWRLHRNLNRQRAPRDVGPSTFAPAAPVVPIAPVVPPLLTMSLHALVGKTYAYLTVFYIDNTFCVYHGVILGQKNPKIIVC